MTEQDAPRTAEALLALPEGGGFGSEERVIDGKTWRIPIAPDLVSFFVEPDTVMLARDRDGQRWRLVQYADGRWCRMRV